MIDANPAAKSQQQGGRHPDDPHGDAGKNALCRAHRQDAVNVGDDGVGDVLVEPRHLRIAKAA